MENPTIFQKIIARTPPDLGRIILSILSQGKQYAIGGSKLVARLELSGCRSSERAVRQVIHDLRRDGHLICSAPGEDGGYYLAATRQEFDEFISRELHPKAMDLLETERAMRASARRVWGDAVQMALI